MMGRYYATLNFNNQVGLVDFDFTYTIGGVEGTLGFCTEVLSYKMNYRSDMKSIIRDIEQEYSMLSYAFLKNTYLSFRTKAGESSELIWWQIFQSCYNDIIRNIHIIINSPKRRLKTAVRYERADRLRYISPEQENEYAELKKTQNIFPLRRNVSLQGYCGESFSKIMSLKNFTAGLASLESISKCS